VILLSIGLVRLADVYLFEHRQWISYLVLGAFFCAIGIFAYSRRVVARHDA
jgi:hypothetical protein